MIVDKNNKRYSADTAPGNQGSDNIYSDNKGKGYEWLILAVPQKANENTYLKVNYDLKYIYNSGDNPRTVIYKNCQEEFKLNTGTFDFPAGKQIKLKVNFYLRAVGMDAIVSEWDQNEDEEDVPHYYDNGMKPGSGGGTP